KSLGRPGTVGRASSDPGWITGTGPQGSEGLRPVVLAAKTGPGYSVEATRASLALGGSTRRVRGEGNWLDERGAPSSLDAGPVAQDRCGAAPQNCRIRSLSARDRSRRRILRSSEGVASGSGDARGSQTADPERDVHLFMGQPAQGS